jgi:RNA polymerase sigma factor (sigma-70 family)
VRKVAYYFTEYLPSYVSECSSLKEYAYGTGPFEWTDDEIAAIRAVLKKLTAIRILNANDAEDLVQETLLTMITRHPGTVLEKGPLVWCLGILRKKVGNYYRKIQRYESLGKHHHVTRQWKNTASPEARIFHKELQTIIREVLSQLPYSQRQALELMVAGFNTGEIVRELHPERYQNVINRLYRGRKRLAKELAKYGYGPNAGSALVKMKRSHGGRMKQLTNYD